MKLKSLLIILFGFIVLSFIGCNKDNPETPDVPDNPDTPEVPEVSLDVKLNIAENEVPAIFEEIGVEEDLATALPALAQRLTQMEEVESAEVRDAEIRVTFADGTSTFLLFRYPPVEEERMINKPNNLKEMNADTVNSKASRDKRAIIWEPLLWESYDFESNQNYGFTDDAQLLRQAGYFVNHVTHNDCTVTSLEQLFDNYSYVMISTHGSEGGDWMATYEHVTTATASDETYQELYRQGLISTASIYYIPNLLSHHATVYVVSADYIMSLEGTFNQSIVHVGMCHGMDLGGGGVIDAFHRKGALGIMGYEGSVAIDYDHDVAYDMTRLLVQEKLTVGEAYRQVHELHPDDPDYNEDGTVLRPNQYRLYSGSDDNACLYLLPQIITSPVETFTTNTALLEGKVLIPYDCQPIVEKGFLYGIEANLSYGQEGVTMVLYEGNEINDFSYEVTGLLSDTKYYVRAFAKTASNVVCYGDELWFTTLGSVVEEDPVVVTIPADNITSSSAVLYGDVAGTNASILRKGFCYSETPNPSIGTPGTNHVVVGSGLGSFNYTLEGLASQKTYYVKAYAVTNAGQTFYGNETYFSTLSNGGGGGDTPDNPSGTLNGAFSVSASQQVVFSQGNLQYQASSNTWRFAEHQWDIIGSDNNKISSTYNGWIDLFGWATSGYNHGGTCYQPWSTSMMNPDYYAYGQEYYNLEDQTGQADWGYNPISNGGNTPQVWRTLTKAEWDYILMSRVTPSGIRFAVGQVNGVNGVILLPDSWSAAYYGLNNTNQTNASYTSNVISAAQWSALETNGAVFLPAGGTRYGTSSFQTGTGGYYWSSTHSTSAYSYSVYFGTNGFYTFESGRFGGQSVRLVHLAR